MKKKVFVSLLIILSFFSCGEKPLEDNVDDKNIVGNKEVKLYADKTSVIRNPMTGRVMYLSADSDVSYFDTEVYVSALGKSVKVRDYASACYIRTKWRVMNPADGKYFWQAELL